MEFHTIPGGQTGLQPDRCAPCSAFTPLIRQGRVLNCGP